MPRRPVINREFYKISPENLDFRKQRILRALITEYVKTARPVGSNTLCKNHNLRVSPATVRNEMSALENMGYLEQPHTSAGRTPTGIAFRFYVNHLVTEKALAARDRQRLRSYYRTGSMDHEEILRETSRALSQVSRHVGIIMGPSFEKNALQSINLKEAARNRILVVFEFSSGIMESRIIKNELKLRENELIRISGYLTETGYGKSLMELREELNRQKIRAEKACEDIIHKALSLSEQIMDEAPGLSLYVEGQVNLFEQPEFSDVEKMKQVFKILDEKTAMIKLLDQVMDCPGVEVIIGKENMLEPLQDYSLVTCSYGSEGRAKGALGIIGPMRIDYGKIMSLVKFTSGLISDIINF